MPTTNNQIVDNISQYFCYGYRLTFNAQEGAMTELYLTKPFTYTSLWSLDQVVLLGETHL